MPVTARWHDANKTIIVLAYHQKWSLREVETRWREIETMLTTIEHSVALIHDATRIDYLPSDSPSFIRRKFPTKHPKIELSIIVGANFIVRTFVNLFTRMKLYPMEMHFCDTLDDALVFIAQQTASSDS
jgi:hypothetical protein